MKNGSMSWNDMLFSEIEIAQLFSDAAMLSRFATFEAALVLAMADAGMVPVARAAAVAGKIMAFSPDLELIRRAMPQDGIAGPEYIRQLRSHVGIDGDSLVHRGATSQDLVDTTTLQAFRSANRILAIRLSETISALDALAERDGDAVLMSHTRLQPAIPIRARDRIDAWTRPLSQMETAFPALRRKLEVLQFGGPVGNLDSFGQHGPAVARALGGRLSMPWPGFCWHTDRSAMAAYAGFLSGLTAALGKIGLDIALMADRGGEIALAGGGSSSAMVHKANPVNAERLVTLARFNATLISGQHHALLHEQERSGSAWMLEWMILPQMVETTAVALTTTIDVLACVQHIGSRL